MSDQHSELQTPSALTLSYAGVSSVERKPAVEQQVCLFTNTAQNQGKTPRVDLTIKEALVFREAMRIFLTLHQPKGTYLPDDPKVYEAFVSWKRGLDPELGSVSLSQSFYDFLEQYDPQAWVGCDPSVSLNPAGLAFETLDPTGRVYAMLGVSPDGYESKGKVPTFCTRFEGGEVLQNGLSTLNNNSTLKLSIGAQAEEVSESCQGQLNKTLPAPQEWLRNFTQIIAASTRPVRTVSLSRMDLYNILQQLRLNADIPKQKKGIRFELVPGKAPALTLEPWNWRLVCTGEVYRGDKAEILGVWDRRDLMIFDALLPYIDRVELKAIGEAQPTFWVLHCGSLTFTLATMGFRPNNWSRGVLLDLSLPRMEIPEQIITQALSALSTVGELSADALAQSIEATESYNGADVVRTLIQSGLVRIDMSSSMLSPRGPLFDRFSPQSLRYRNSREQQGTELADLKRVKMTLSELPTGEVEVLGEVTALPAEHLPVEAVYKPRFQMLEGAGMRKVGCDCAWMKDREKQKIGPCPHVIALWVKYAREEAKRQAELAANPDKVEVATSVFFKRQRGLELSRIVELKRKSLAERWEDEGQEPRYFHRVFSNIAAARAAYFKRVAELERRDYMDASQS